MWSTHRAFQPRRGVVEGCRKVPRGCKSSPCSFPGAFLTFFLSSLFFSWCCFLAAGLDHRQECFGVTMPCGSPWGAALGSAVGRAQAGVCLSNTRADP